MEMIGAIFPMHGMLGQRQRNGILHVYYQRCCYQL